MAMTLEQLNDTYFSDSKVVELTGQTEITNMLESKASCCWGAGEVISDGWIKLCQPSNASLNSKPIVFVCRSENLPA